jgi:putative N6-adenine-specific DNA methylase
VAAARANAGRAGVAEDVTFTQAALGAAPWPAADVWLVTNPPYGVRIGDRAALRDLYASLGKLAPRTRALVVITADAALEAQLGSPREVVLESRVGGIPIRVIRRWGRDSEKSSK